MDAAELLLHPVRLRIIHAVLDGRLFTTADLCRELVGVSQNTIYRHLARLVEGGLVQVDSEQRIRGAVQRNYRLTPHRPLVGQEASSALSRQERRQLFAILTSTLMAEFDRHLDHQDPDQSPDAASYREHALWLTDAERDQLHSRLAAVIANAGENEPTLGRRRHLLTTVLFPTQP